MTEFTMPRHDKTPHTLADLAALWLADGLSKSDDPIATNPSQLMVAAGLTPDAWQSELLQSQWQRALLLCSRQTGKSTVTAALATWLAQYRPESLVLILSAAQRQSGELFRKVKDFYALLPNRLAVRQESALQLELINGSRIIALPGKEQTIRSFSGVDLLIIDEAARVDDALYASVRPMLAVSGGRLICLSTPFGRRGFFHQEWEEGADDWHRVKVTANQCPRISPVFLEEERRSIGDWWFKQEYECQFLDTIDSVFSFDDVQAALSDDLAPLLTDSEWANLWQS